MADPTINANTIVFDMEDDTDYTLTDTVLNDVSWEGFYGFLLTQAGTPLGDELDDSDYSNWYDSSTFTPELDIVAFGDQSVKAESSSDDSSTENFWGNPNLSEDSVGEIWFYDDGVANSAYERSVFFLAGGAKAPYSVAAGIALDNDIHASNYLYWNAATSTLTDTGITRSTEWHSVRYRFVKTTQDFGEPILYLVQLYLDGTRLVNLSLADPPDTCVWKRAKSVQIKTQETGKPWYIDRIRGRKGAKLYEETGTVETPPAQPSAVISWNSIDEMEDTEGNWKGSTTYEFQWSTDGGSSWNGSWLDADESNLSAVTCDEDGDDAIKFRITLEQHEDKLHTPRVRGLTLNYTSAAITVEMGVVTATIGPAYSFTRDDLIANPSFELDAVSHEDGWTEYAADAITGWESDAPFALCYIYWQCRADDGDYFLSGGIDTMADGDAWQDIELAALGFNTTEIDAGNATVDSFSCRRLSESSDKGRVLVEFLNAAKANISTPLDTGFDVDATKKVWSTKSFSSEAVPANTRYIRITLGKEHLYGTTSGACFDNLLMTVSCTGANFTVDVGDPYVLVEAEAVSLACSPESFTLSLGAIAKIMNALALTGAGKDTTLALGGIGLTMEKIAATGAALDMSLLPGSVSLEQNVLALTATPKDLTLSLGAIATTLDLLGLTITPPDAELTPGSVALVFEALGLTATPQDISFVMGATGTSMNAIALTAACGDIAIGLGAIELLMDRLALTGAVLDFTLAGEQIITLAAIALTCVPNDLLVRLGTIVLDDQRGIIVAVEDRQMTVDVEARTIVVETEDRTIVVAADSRQPTVPGEARSVAID